MNDHDQLSARQVRDIGIPEEEPAFLDDLWHDRFIEALIALGGELWIERERRAKLESLILAKTDISADDLRNHDISDDERERAAAELSAFVERVIGPLKSS